LAGLNNQTYPQFTAIGSRQLVQVGNNNNECPVGPSYDLLTNSGGQSTVSVPSGAGNTVIKAGPGRLCRVVITTLGSGSGDVTFYDNATTNSGTVLFRFINTQALATYLPAIDMPAANGITVANVANGPVFTVSYL
jgi:hypothetical protein